MWRVCGHNCTKFHNQRPWTRELYLKKMSWRPVDWQINWLIGQLFILCGALLRKEQQKLCPVSTRCRILTLRGFRHLTPLQLLENRSWKQPWVLNTCWVFGTCIVQGRNLGRKAQFQKAATTEVEYYFMGKELSDLASLQIHTFNHTNITFQIPSLRNGCC